jgi:hypothetical protein
VLPNSNQKAARIYAEILFGAREHLVGIFDGDLQAINEIDRRRCGIGKWLLQRTPE